MDWFRVLGSPVGRFDAVETTFLLHLVLWLDDLMLFKRPFYCIWFSDWRFDAVETTFLLHLILCLGI
ncbi:MAG: hypothetical protein ACQEUT_20235 [Bacillota bacterium]